MSNLLARTYDDLVAVTVSDTTADPAGPFACLLVTAAGTLKISTVAHPTSSVTLAGTVVGQQINTPIQRVWSTGTSATALGYKGTTSGGLFK
jgi:hypothetical protein